MFSLNLSSPNISCKKIYIVCSNTFSIYSSAHKQKDISRWERMSDAFTFQLAAQKCLFPPAKTKVRLDAAKSLCYHPQASFRRKKKSTEMQPGGNTTLVCHPVTCTNHPSTETSFAAPLKQQSVAFILSSVTLISTWLSFPFVFICSSPTSKSLCFHLSNDVFAASSWNTGESFWLLTETLFQSDVNVLALAGFITGWILSRKRSTSKLQVQQPGTHQVSGRFSPQARKFNRIVNIKYTLLWSTDRDTWVVQTSAAAEQARTLMSYSKKLLGLTNFL